MTDGTAMDHLARLSRARWSDDVAAAVAAEFGDEARLYAVDHAFDELVEIGVGSSAIALDGDLRTAVLRSEPVGYDGSTWIPLPDRGRSIFVVRDADRPPPAPATWGQVLFDHLSRFEELERQRRRADMDVAAGLQHDLLPVASDDVGEWSVGALLEPAYSVAGDLFDHAFTDGALWAYSLDGMGHGLEATMSGVLALTAIRNARREGASLAEQMNQAGAVLHDQYHGDRFVTAVGCRVTSDGSEFVNAGHEPVRSVVGGVVSALELDAEIPLGVVADHRYLVQRHALPAPGDGITLFSDGPVLARSSAGDEFGAARLDRSLEQRWSDSAVSCAYGVLDDLRAFMDGAEVADDISVIVLRRSDA